MDEDRIEALGITPIQPDLDRIAGIDSTAAFAAEVGRLSALNAGGPFGASFGIDAASSSRLIVTISQGGTLPPQPGYFVNGELTLGENIGDLVGLAVAVRAYRLSLKGRPAPVIDGFTGEQRLFLNWARVWRSQVRTEYVPQTLILNRQAPSQFRANGAVVNLEAFHEAFDVRPGDQLYRPPAHRSRIW